MKIRGLGVSHSNVDLVNLVPHSAFVLRLRGSPLSYSSMELELAGKTDMTFRDRGAGGQVTAQPKTRFVPKANFERFAEGGEPQPYRDDLKIAFPQSGLGWCCELHQI